MGMAELIIIVVGAVILYSVARRVSSEKPKNESLSWQSSAAQMIDWDAIQHLDVYEDIQENRKISAIKHYRELTGCGLKEAKEAIEYVIAHGIPQKGKLVHSKLEMSDAGIRDLIAEGKIDEAVDVYRQFAGIDKFSAREAVEQLQREMRLIDQSRGESALDSPSESSSQKQSEG